MAEPFRVACVSYLNARPLIQGLSDQPGVRLLLDVPSKLPALMREGHADVALLPVIDYQRLDGLMILPAGGIGSDGATLTVRIFSRVPIPEISALACDTESHTSVALARIILSRRHGLNPEFCQWPQRPDDPAEARLLIGDKVVCAAPDGFPYQLDLGSEWKALTGLPFVFATWMARTNAADPAALYAILAQAKERGLAAIDQIIESHARPAGWPLDVARRYLTRHLRFDVGDRELDAIRLFHQLAAEAGLINSPRPLRIWEPSCTTLAI